MSDSSRLTIVLVRSPVFSSLKHVGTLGVLFKDSNESCGSPPFKKNSAHAYKIECVLEVHGSPKALHEPSKGFNPQVQNHWLRSSLRSLLRPDIPIPKAVGLKIIDFKDDI